MSFQITILKVLAGHPNQVVSVAELTRYVTVLISSGSDWSNRMRRLSLRAPQLDLFGSGFFLRQNHGWQITNAGLQFLRRLEASIETMPQSEQHPESLDPSPSLKLAPAVRLVVDNTRTVSKPMGPGRLSA